METLRIDGYIGRDGEISLFGADRNKFSLGDLNRFLDSLPEDAKDLTIEINSEGGIVDEGFAIHDKLVSSGLNIHTEITGLCGSIATVIALAAPLENRSMHSNSKYFIHNPYWLTNEGEALEADDLDVLSDDLRTSQEDILNHYVKKTSQTKAKLQSFMKQKRNLSASEAKEMGFISKIISEAVNNIPLKYRIAACINTKPANMDFSDTQKTWIEQKFNALYEKFNKVFTPIFKAMVMDLENGGKIFIETEDANNIKGMKVFTVGDDGNKTNIAAPDGEYQLKDKRTLTVASGVITEVKEPEVTPNETEALKKQVEELTAQLATANTKAETSATEKANLETQVVAMKKEVNVFRDTILGGDIPPAGQNFKGDNTAKTENEKWLDYKKSKKENQNK